MKRVTRFVVWHLVVSKCTDNTTDTLKPGEILKMEAEREPVVVFSYMYLGDLIGARRTKACDEGFKYGYVALSAESLLALLEEICYEIRKN